MRQEAETDLDVKTDPPNKQEIIAAIKTLKNNKAPDQNNLNVDLFNVYCSMGAGESVRLLDQTYHHKDPSIKFL